MTRVGRPPTVPPRRCEVDGCDGLHRARGMCNAHWLAWRQTPEGQAAVVEAGTLDPAPLVAVLLARHGGSKRAAAEAVGVHPNAVWRWVDGSRRIRLRTAEDICDRLRLHPTELWGLAYYEAAVA